jgi:hypothetical protein
MVLHTYTKQSQSEFTRMSATSTNELISSMTSLMNNYTREIVSKLSTKYGFSAEEALTFLNEPVQVVEQPVQEVEQPIQKKTKQEKATEREEKLKLSEEKRQVKAAVREEKAKEKEEAKLVKAALKAGKKTITIPDKEFAFTTAQVEIMTDEELLENFTKVTGATHLGCNHCHHDRVELASFVKTIRRWCLKKENVRRTRTGLFKEMQIPKTCDHQAAANRLRQPYYTKIKKANTDEQLEALKKANTHLFGPDRRKKTVRA